MLYLNNILTDILKLGYDVTL